MAIVTGSYQRHFRDCRFAALGDDRGPYGFGIVGDYPSSALQISNVDRPPNRVALRADIIKKELNDKDDEIVAFQLADYSRALASSFEGRVLRLQEYFFAMRDGMSPRRFSYGIGGELDEEVRSRVFERRQRYASMAIESVNKVIGTVVEAAIPPALLGLVGRFPLPHRYRIYRHAAISPRFAQLAETFPALAMKIALPGASADAATDAVALVERGAPLKHVAAVMRVSMALRRIGPELADLAAEASERLLNIDSAIYTFLPQNGDEYAAWLKAVTEAAGIDRDYGRWMARNFPSFEGDNRARIRSAEDIGDWVRACVRMAANPNIDMGPIQRPFRPDMSPWTARRLSDRWHRDIARFPWNLGDDRNPPGLANAHGFGNSREFPAPWLEGGIIGDVEIVPIRRARDLYEEARRMSNCASSYVTGISAGDCFLYSVRKNDWPIAMVELRRGSGGIRIGQFRGRLNAEPPNEALEAVKWWSTQRGIDQGTASPTELPFGVIDSFNDLAFGSGVNEDEIEFDTHEEEENEWCHDDWYDEKLVFALYSDDEYLGDEFPEGEVYVET